MYRVTPFPFSAKPHVLFSFSFLSTYHKNHGHGNVLHLGLDYHTATLVFDNTNEDNWR